MSIFRSDFSFTLHFIRGLAVCLGLEGIPIGDQHCSRGTENIGPNGRDPSPVISQSDRVVKPPVYQPGGCVVCRFVYVIAVN